MLRLGWCLHYHIQGSCHLNVALPCGLALSASLRDPCVSKPGTGMARDQAHLVETEREREEITIPCKGDGTVLLNGAFRWWGKTINIFSVSAFVLLCFLSVANCPSAYSYFIVFAKFFPPRVQFTSEYSSQKYSYQTCFL